jgi:hypothetical protein
VSHAVATDLDDVQNEVLGDFDVHCQNSGPALRGSDRLGVPDKGRRGRAVRKAGPRVRKELPILRGQRDYLNAKIKIRIQHMTSQVKILVVCTLTICIDAEICLKSKTVSAGGREFYLRCGLLGAVFTGIPEKSCSSVAELASSSNVHNCYAHDFLITLVTCKEVMCCRGSFAIISNHRPQRLKPP